MLYFALRTKTKCQFHYSLLYYTQSGDGFTMLRYHLASIAQSDVIVLLRVNGLYQRQTEYCNIMHPQPQSLSSKNLTFPYTMSSESNPISVSSLNPVSSCPITTIAYGHTAVWMVILGLSGII